MTSHLQQVSWRLVVDTDSFVKASAEIQTTQCDLWGYALPVNWQKWLCWASRCLVTI
jgi:hypothetical protein